MSRTLSRRSFAGTLGLAAGAALIDSPFGRVAEAASRMPRPAGAILLNSNENPYGPSPKAARQPMCRRGASRTATPTSSRTRCARRSRGITAWDEDQVVLGCGSSQILQMADAAFAGPGRRVVAAEPTFEAVLRYAKAIRAEGITVPLTGDFRHDLPKMAAAAAGGAGLVYVCNPNNPTGTIVTGDELAAFVAAVPPTVTILVDEAYHHFVEDPRYRSAAELIGKAPNVVVARTFSKIYGMAGLRLGYAVGSKEKIAEMAKFASFSNANAGVLAAALASLADPDLVPRQRKVMNDTRRGLVAEMEKQGRRTIPSEANFVMIDVGGDVAPVIAAFRKRNILVGRKFASLPNWLRITIGTPDEMRAFSAALAEIVPAKAAA